jgi:predicted double-glycine peptidase
MFFSLVASAGDGLADRVDWKKLRDAQVVKQRYDYSCGAASVATILRHYYGLDVDEMAVLTRIPDLDDDLSASFLELEEAVKSFDFQVQGVELEFETLKKLSVPAIAHLRFEGREHFSVIRGIDPATGLVWLADPSWGNRHFSRYQFRALWGLEEGGAGRLLLVVPVDGDAAVADDFFNRPDGRLGLAEALLRQSSYSR